MVKRKRNTIGQFISSSSMSIGSKNRLLQENFMQKAKTIFMVLFFILIASPWLTLAIKSKQIKIWINLVFQFCARHFISEDEIKERFCTPTNGDI